MKFKITIIEILIVLAVIGILAAIAIPSYCNYLIPSRVAEVLNVAEKAKAVVLRYYQQNGVMPENARHAGINLDPQQNRYLRSITYQRNSPYELSLTFTFNDTLTQGAPLSRNSDGKTLVIAGSGDAARNIAWNCSSGDLAGKDRPSVCRKRD